MLWWWWIGGEGWFLVMGCESFVVRRSYLGKEEEVVSPFFFWKMQVDVEMQTRRIKDLQFSDPQNSIVYHI